MQPLPRDFAAPVGICRLLAALETRMVQTESNLR